MAPTGQCGFFLWDREVSPRNPNSSGKSISTQRRETVRDAARNSSSGFSVFEMLVVVVIILIVAALTVPSLLAAVNQARVAKAAGDLRTIQEEISLYQNTFQALPDDLSQVGYGSNHDPWGNPYQYFNLDTLKGNGMARVDRFLLPLNDDYELYSMGKDGRTAPSVSSPDGLDDVVRAGSGSYVGLGSLY